MPPEYEEVEIRGMLENNERIDQAVKNKSPKLPALCGRRAMVSKFWCQEIGRRWRQRRQEPPHARLLTEPRCQSYVATWYLLYRWIIFLLWTSIVVCSLFEFGSYNPLLMYEKWAIYLTNWDLALGFMQALIGGILVSKRWRLQRIKSFDPCHLRFKSIERFYWFLYVVTTNIAIGVTVSYWLAVYDPKTHDLDPLNFLLHVCNSVLMLVDLFMTSIPFHLRSFWWTLSIVAFYLLFSVIYYIAGGLDKHGYHYIYKILDWKKPTHTIPMCVGGLTFVTVLHCVICMLANVRERLYQKFVARKDDKTSSTVTSDKSLPEKRTEEV